MTTAVKRRFGYDDSLDVFGVHGSAGTVGALLTGVFATFAINPIFKDANGQPLPVGAIDGNLNQIVNQLIAIGASWLLAAVGTLAVLKLVDVTVGLRVSDTDEAIGLDLTQHGDEAYVFDAGTVPAALRGLAPELPAPNRIGPDADA